MWFLLGAIASLIAALLAQRFVRRDNTFLDEFVVVVFAAVGVTLAIIWLTKS
ncbi:MAG TPA: hypothetical protein VK978_05170 [Candidatus Saccharimonadales bacterium]|nr:hypothetical protein [Candidatus Saccharimonadales bacterium]